MRYIVQGFGDRDKPFMVHDANSLCASCIRLILSISACLRFRVFSHGVTQAYLRSKYKMTRDVFIKPKERDRELLDLNFGDMLKLKMPL